MNKNKMYFCYPFHVHCPIWVQFDRRLVHVIRLDILSFVSISEGKAILKVQNALVKSRSTPFTALCWHAAKAILKSHVRTRGDWLPETVKQLRRIPIHAFVGIAASAFAYK
jgi:hypothetical protein